MRPIGRRTSEASPVKVVAKAWLPATPERQAHTGAGIAVVDDALGLEQAADAEAGDPPVAAAGRGDRGAEGAHGGGGGEHVLAFEQALDRGLADGQRPQHQGAVRDRLVAGRAHGAGQRAGSPRRQRMCRIIARHG